MTINPIWQGFVGHLKRYLLVMVLLVLVNVWRTPQVWWWIWPAMGWGSALLWQGFACWASQRAASRF